MHIPRAIAISLVCCHVVYACNNPQNNASLNQNSVPSGWAANTQVTVYIDTTQFSSTQITAIEQAFTNWQNSAYSGKDTYNFVTLSGQPVPTGHYVVIRRETPTPNGVPDSTAAAYTSWAYTYSSTDKLDYVANSKMQINPDETNPTTLTEIIAHENGHDNFLGECNGCPLGSSVMASGDVVNGTSGNLAPTACDTDKANQYRTPPPCTQLCPRGTTAPCNTQCPPSPIIIDVDGSGFNLTDAAHGVSFDIDNSGIVEQIAWTKPGSTNAFLALDRNGNGTIDNGGELFGNYTAQPPVAEPNGFNALSIYDLIENGGNGDGVIDSRDAIYSKLLLWIDANHDGISQPDELFKLSDLGVTSISLNYKASKWLDQYGNEFWFRSKVGSRGVPWCYDVFLLELLSSSSPKPDPTALNEAPLFAFTQRLSRCERPTYMTPSIR